MILAPLEKQRLYRQVADEIKRYILDHGLKHGDALPTEVEFAERLGVSRPTVREALKGLEMLGILGGRRGSGHAVGSLDLLELARQFSFHVQMEGINFREMVETRLLLEVNILPFVAERATEEDFVRLQEATDTVRRGCEQRDWGACVVGDIAFHQTLFEASRNRFLTSFAGVVKEFFVDIRRTLFEPADILDAPEGGVSLHRERVNQEHQAICDALRQKDVRRAQEVMYAHLSVYLKDEGKRV